MIDDGPIGHGGPCYEIERDQSQVHPQDEPPASRRQAPVGKEEQGQRHEREGGDVEQAEEQRSRPERQLFVETVAHHGVAARVARRGEGQAGREEHPADEIPVPAPDDRESDARKPDPEEDRPERERRVLVGKPRERECGDKQDRHRRGESRSDRHVPPRHGRNPTALRPRIVTSSVRARRLRASRNRGPRPVGTLCFGLTRERRGSTGSAGAECSSRARRQAAENGRDGAARHGASAQLVPYHRADRRTLGPASVPLAEMAFRGSTAWPIRSALRGLRAPISEEPRVA